MGFKARRDYPGVYYTMHLGTVYRISRPGRIGGRDRSRCRLLCLSAGCGIALIAASYSHAADPAPGKDIYDKHCAMCHGSQGEGTEEHFPRPLAGDRSVAQLARFIAKSMPPETPGTCTGEDADRVAAYIYEAFYSPAAQIRRQPPRIDPARLTARQYADTIADLMVAFFGTAARDGSVGLRGNYAAINANGDGKQVLSRVDAEVKFDFGTSSPDPEKIEPAEFAISWIGSIRTPATGEYEFIVRSPNSFK